MVLVIMCVSCQLCTLFIFTKLYQEEAPYQTHHQIRVRRRLPNITGSFARDANLLGGFGLAAPPLPTLTTLRIWLYRGHAPPLPSTTAARRGLGIIRCYNGLDVLTVVGYEMIPIYFALGIGRVVTGLCE